jgi:hypothetical protein
MADFGDLFAEAFNPSPRTIRTEFEGHDIAVRLSQSAVKLIIDDKEIQSERPVLLPNKTIPILEATIKDGNAAKHKIDVYGKSGMLKACIKMCIDGKKVAGDDF